MFSNKRWFVRLQSIPFSYYTGFRFGYDSLCRYIMGWSLWQCNIPYPISCISYTCFRYWTVLIRFSLNGVHSNIIIITRVACIWNYFRWHWHEHLLVIIISQCHQRDSTVCYCFCSIQPHRHRLIVISYAYTIHVYILFVLSIFS